jgi:hypothetical protein
MDQNGDDLIEAADPSLERKVLWKIDLVIMPLIIVGMTLAFLDKVIAQGDDHNCCHRFC